MSPELIRMDIALRINAGDPNAGGIKSAPIPAKPLVNFFGFRILSPRQFEVDIGPVCVIVNRKNLKRETPSQNFISPDQDPVDRMANLFHLHRKNFSPAAARHQVVKTDAPDSFPFNEIKKKVNMNHGFLSQRKSEPRLLTCRNQIPNSRNRFLKSSGHAAELIVDHSDPVQADA